MKKNISGSVALLSLLVTTLWFGCKKDSDKDPAKSTCNRTTASSFTIVATDSCGDGKMATRLDGTQLSYRYDADADSIWFLLSVQAVSASQGIGINVMVNNGKPDSTFIFWGADNKNAFHKLLTVWVTGSAPSAYSGTIGIADAAGVVVDDYTNRFSNNISIFVNTTNNTLLIGLKRKDLVPDADFGTSNTLTLKVASAVGAHDGWNDDVLSSTSSITLTKVVAGTKPTLTTSPVGSITSRSILSGGSISSDGGQPVTKRGLCWSKTEINPTLDNSNKAALSGGSGDFSFTISNLTPNTTYYLRAYATNSNGTSYGNGISFDTKAAMAVTTSGMSFLTATSCQGTGDVTNDGGSPILERGIAYSKKNTNPTLADSTTADVSAGMGSFNVSVSGLAMASTYYLRAYARTAIDTAYGAANMITTLGPPTVSTYAPDQIIDIRCRAFGNVTASGGATVTTRGFVVGTSANPTLGSAIAATAGSGVSNFQTIVTGLSPLTNYHIRAYAINTYGTSYGEDLTFTTLNTCESVNDLSGNTYPVVRIGNQCWMKENLKTLYYKNGTNIAVVPDNTPWSNLTTPAVCTLKNDPLNVAKYGLLYNWYVANQDNVCPTGWHVPTTAEWTQLIDYLGGATVAGGKMKLPGSTWTTPNVGADNSSGFSALGAGYREFDGNFYGEKAQGVFWAKETSDDPLRGNRTYLAYYDAVAQQHNEPKKKGMSIRCVKD